MQETEINHEWLMKYADRLNEAHPAFFAVDPRTPTEIHFFKDRNAFRDWLRKLNEIEAGRTFIGHTAETIAPLDDEDSDSCAQEDPCLAWCIDNVEMFRDHDPAFVAVDMRKSCIVLSESDETSFQKKISSFTPEERAHLFVTHTSVIVG